jgi:prophage regulatory protein
VIARRKTVLSRKDEVAPQRIIRLKEVLQRTGLSRSSIYTRIAKNEFPHQVSLGPRSVGWLKGEVEGWINKRIQARPDSVFETSDTVPAEPNEISETAPFVRKQACPRSTEPISCVVSVSDGSPDFAQLQLLAIKLHFHRGTGTFWLQLLPEK